jgi:hypothetical protein
VIAANYLVLQGGTLQVGTQANPVASNVKATILTADQPLNTAIDPEQYGDSLIGLGNVTIYGAAKTPFGRLAVEPKAGNTTLTFASPVSGWQPGDTLFLPDTRQLDWNQRTTYYVPQWENATIASVSSDGLTVTLTSPLQYDHLGARDGNGVLQYLPHVADETRNVAIASQNSTGNRGTAMFLQRANVNINSAAFLGLGRTTDDAIDNTTFNSNGQVTHIGTNEQNRTPVDFLNLWGPTTAQANGYQYTFTDNVVRCIMEVQDHIWGIEVNNSSYGLIQGNVVDNWSGAGISLVSGTEVYNRIEGNFVARIDGYGSTRTTTGLDGLGYWSFNPDNAFVNNVATDINQYGPYSYGYDINASFLGAVNVAAYQGADPALAGQSTSVNMNAIPLLQFSGNEVYGATPNGLSLWWIGAFYRTPLGNAGTVQNFVVWHQHNWGYFGYETNNLTISGFIALGDPNVTEGISKGMWFADYMQQGLVITDANIQGEAVGIESPQVSNGAIAINNSYFCDATDVLVTTMGSVNGADGLPAKSTILQNDTFAALPGQPLAAIVMDYETSGLGTAAACNLIQTDQVFVYNYNGVTGDNFQVYYNQQAASFIVPQTNSLYQGLIGSPAAGLTNQQNWNTYGIAIAGAVAPSNATTRSGIVGLVVPLTSGGSMSGNAISVPPATPSSGSATATGLGTTSALMPPASSPSTTVATGSLSGVIDPTPSIARTTASTGAKSTAKVRGSQGTTSSVIAGPLALSVARRNQVVEAVAKSARFLWAWGGQ